MSAIGNGSNVLAVVAGCTLTACVVGIRLVNTVLAVNHHPHTVANLVSHNSPVVAIQASPTAVPTEHLAVTAPTHKTQQVVPTAVVPTAVPASDQTIVNGDQSTFISRTAGFTLSYLNSWTTTHTGQAFGVLAADNNAGVVVSVEASDALDITGLETELISRLPAFLQQYGGAPSSTPQFQMDAVDGVQGVVGTLAVTKNGQVGMASVSAIYSGGHIYFVAGVIADQTADTAAQDDAQVVEIMNSFHLRP